MSKSQRIRDLLETTDLSNQEIADKVGCLDAYVRVIQARLLHGGSTPSEKSWRSKNIDKHRKNCRDRNRFRWHTDEAYRERRKASMRTYERNLRMKRSAANSEV